ncbi:Bestrophin, RFP-TM, chloride channel-domain-containing protein [Xylariales sp. PMI_506]|nr:Bestrophin, RFP-TM, chloride channel-domain-containing protein [Xylariales sp. PMI_506]
MSEEGGGFAVASNGGAHGDSHDAGHDMPSLKTNVDMRANVEEYPSSPRGPTPNPFSRQHTSIYLDDYFSGPRDTSKHSKWPLFLQMHGSILPKMFLPLIFVGLWATCITMLSKMVPNVNLAVNSVLLTVLGFVVSLGLSFRSSTGYERYAEGRRAWGQLNLTCQQLGRVFWLHTNERPNTRKEDLLAKLTAMNLLVAYAVSLKHRLRFEPYSDYEDLTSIIDHLDTFSKEATADGDHFTPKDPNFFKRTGERLGVSFAASNPRKILKKAKNPLGNLPLEIICYLSAYADEIVSNGQLPIPMTQTLLYNGIAALNDVLTTTDRVLNTPLPIAYTIAISQITWVYVILLPFQLITALSWITIPASVAAAYIILGILFIGREVENPFGNDVNDLPLELFCLQVMQDMEVISSRPKPRISDYVASSRNKVLYPYSDSSYHSWASRPEETIRNALRNRPHAPYGKTAQSTSSTIKDENGFLSVV